jgi:adenine-specific DNA-methyltransferase
MRSNTLSILEAHRLELQTELDAKKSNAERNKLGQYPTPTQLATHILEQASRLIPSDIPIRFLDPALGTGTFFSALLRVFANRNVERARGYEIDPHYGDEAQLLWHERSLDIIIKDFTAVPPPTSDASRYNLIVCNPPYVRHHHLKPTEKKRLQSLVHSCCDIQLSGLSGLYVYFLCLAHQWLSEGGIAGWLIPSEFMDVNYGKGVREYLTSKVTLLEIHRFEPEEVQFDDALVSSAIVWFRKEKPSPTHKARFTQGGSVSQPRYQQMISVADLKVENKWSRFPKSGIRAVDHDVVRIADLFDIKRGVATGANQFFILDSSHELITQLPSEFLTPILPSPRYLEDEEILADSEGLPNIRQWLYLLTCDLPESIIQEDYPALWTYLLQGKAQGIHKRYLCRQRSIWYSQDKRAPSPFLCTYMGRRTNDDKASPFRFILNHSRAIVPNVYLNMYPKPLLRQRIEENPSLAIKVWQALQAIPAEKLIGEGRVYGGGLHKLEPKELGNLPVSDVFVEDDELPLYFPRQRRLF